jgi:selenide,water dikinase
VILAAEMRGRASAQSYAAAIAAMRQSGAAAASCLVAHDATACTDVTGFGLLGHLTEMLTASGAAARLDPSAIPALDGAKALLAGGLTSSLHAGNSAALAALAPEDAPGNTDADPVFAALLIDPQTAGGLLAGIPAERAEDCVGELVGLGYRAAAIGVVTVPRRGAPLVSLAVGCASDPDLAPPLAVAGE